VHFSEEMLDRCKWNVNTSQALVRNFLLINNSATWFFVLQRFLLHFVCVCVFFFTGFNITPQFPPPPPKKEQCSENLVLQRFLLHFVCVFFLGGGGWVVILYLVKKEKKKRREHNGVRTTAVSEIRLQIILLFKLYTIILFHWKSFYHL
jgi:hypothetical protein